MTDSVQNEKALFEAARNLTDPAARAAFLEENCKTNPRLRTRLERLLAVGESADKFFEPPVALDLLTDSPAHAGPASSASTPGPVPDRETARLAGTSGRIGRYQLLERLGEGGCGVVYLAEQVEPVRRRVAFKIIRLGMDTESVIARFEAERQALALMDHPNIAHVLDAGATEAGRPYFVMEWVRGVKVTQFCNENQYDTRQRLQLFVQICHAVQHAHQKGVIHRDLKPSNILVAMHDGVAVPKVIDFGIAKATEGRLTDDTIHTALDQFIGTPAYMSPEQAEMSGLDVDTRSDIYSLGVLLYELLTGQTPFDSKELAKAGVSELRRTLREREPQPPSTMLTTLGNTKLHAVAAQHHAEPPRLISTVRGDLDWIVLKALEKDRRRRYETANALAVDVQRYLNNETVLARPPSRLYRLRKLMRRNRITFAAIAAVTLALVAGISVSTWLFVQEREAHRRAAEAEQQQIRLREESDRLRQQAEFRQRLTEANVARIRDKIADADRLVAGIPAPEPNLEYADLYRTLGDWHAAKGRWKQAAERFAVLMQVNQPDDWDVTTLDYLRYGPLLLETGDDDGYERFRQSAVEHFAGATNPVPVERVIKVSLLTPPSADLLAALASLEATASNSLALLPPSTGRDASLLGWRAFSLSLMSYRRGNYANMEEWRQKSLAYDPKNHIRDLTFEVMMAMANYKTGRADQGRIELTEARQALDADFNQMTATGWQGYWFDWVFARILLREATALLDQPQP